MQNMSRLVRAIFIAIFPAVFILMGITVQAQEVQLQIDAVARGTSTQMGRIQNIKIYIYNLSSAEDQKVLIDAFAKDGNDGMVKALGKMKEMGRISVPARTGYAVRYIREFPSENGRRFRLVTERPISFGEARSMTRSEEYSISAIDLTISADGKTGKGTLLPACMLKVNKDKELEVEAYQNPWDLTNFTVHTKKEKE